MSATLRLSELYRCLLGESSGAGLPCVLVRLTGCNLRCVWCDSAFSFHGGERLSVTEVVERVLAFPDRLVLLTGGEPLLQPGVHELMDRLLAAGRNLLLETSGSLDISTVDPRVVRIVDIKCPASGESGANLWSNLELLRPTDEIKFVIADRGDYEWAREQIASRALGLRAPVLMGVVAGALEPRLLAQWILEDGLEVRFQLQLHKVLWPGEERGH